MTSVLKCFSLKQILKRGIWIKFRCIFLDVWSSQIVIRWQNLTCNPPCSYGCWDRKAWQLPSRWIADDAESPLLCWWSSLRWNPILRCWLSHYCCLRYRCRWTMTVRSTWIAGRWRRLPPAHPSESTFELIHIAHIIALSGARNFFAACADCQWPILGRVPFKTQDNKYFFTKRKGSNLICYST